MAEFKCKDFLPNEQDAKHKTKQLNKTKRKEKKTHTKCVCVCVCVCVCLNINIQGPRELNVLQIEKTCKLRKHLHQFDNTCSALQLLKKCVANSILYFVLLTLLLFSVEEIKETSWNMNGNCCQY